MLCFTSLYSVSLSLFYFPLKKKNDFPFVCLFPVSCSSKYLPLLYMLGTLTKVNRTA